MNITKISIHTVLNQECEARKLLELKPSYLNISFCIPFPSVQGNCHQTIDLKIFLKKEHYLLKQGHPPHKSNGDSTYQICLQNRQYIIRNYKSIEKVCRTKLLSVTITCITRELYTLIQNASLASVSIWLGFTLSSCPTKTLKIYDTNGILFFQVNLQNGEKRDKILNKIIKRGNIFDCSILITTNVTCRVNLSVTNHSKNDGPQC